MCAFVALLCLPLSAALAAPGESNGPGCRRYDMATRSCDLWDSSGSTESGSYSAGSSPGAAQAGAPRSCSFEGRSISCESAIGSWSSYASAWCRLAPVQPELSDPIWNGRAEGQVYECARPGFDGIPDPNLLALRWLPTPPEAPDPEDLARRLLASIEFQAPELGIFPPATQCAPWVLSGGMCGCGRRRRRSCSGGRSPIRFRKAMSR